MSTGTSIATAHVSGVVALMLERDPSLTPARRAQDPGGDRDRPRTQGQGRAIRLGPGQSEEGARGGRRAQEDQRGCAQDAVAGAVGRREWCCRTGLNCGPPPYQGGALPLSYGSRTAKPPRNRGRTGAAQTAIRGLAAQEKEFFAGVAVRKFALSSQLVPKRTSEPKRHQHFYDFGGPLNPKFAKVLAEQSCELRVRATSLSFNHF